MNNKQYILVTKIDNQNYSIIQGPNYLPESFGPTSGFNFLEQNSPELLSDLTWQGSPNLAFWVAIFNEKPSININQNLINNEINLLKIIDNPYCIKLLEIFESDKYIYLIFYY